MTASSFANLQNAALRVALRMQAAGVRGAPIALWLPVLPSAAGLNNIVRYTAAGSVPERWFTQIDPKVKEVSIEKRLTNALLPLVGRLSGTRLPRPEWAAANNPEPVLEWCLDALGRGRGAQLCAYASSAVRLAKLAAERDVSLDGLVLVLAGEPVTKAKAEAVRAVGARPINSYAFTQTGDVAVGCALRPEEVLHLWDQEVAVVTRRVQRADGEPVDAFLWTTLQPEARSFFINVENDDYGIVSVDEPPCGCELGRAGMRTTLSNVRGMSKVAAGGVSVSGDVLASLAEDVLPQALGGWPADYQFSEEEHNGQSRLVLRIDPSVPGVDETTALAVVRDRIRQSEFGMLADEVWSPTGALRIERAAPQATRSGKILSFEGLAPPAP
jgi:hypothetical protein